jgi:carboxyl-terminal processing protease
MKKKNFFSNSFAATVIVAVLIGLLIDTTVASSNDDFYEGLTLVDKVLSRIHTRYVEEVDVDELITHAINGAIEILDPHTTFFEPKDYDELMVHTQGEFGGLGIQIALRDKILTVMTPIAGTPAERAGIRSGDQILKIEDKSTKKITLEKAVSQMRGEPGTKVTISIYREGEPELIDYEITRAIIDIKSVPYAGLFNDTIGYVKLNSFSQDAGVKVSGAVDSLLKLGMKGLVFDLRSNPGGLLTQAREVSEIFLEPKSLVVFTKGRVDRQNQQLVSSNREPLLPADFPLVVMVNGGSASAAEIVAGAVQDWDRGVVLGDTTFGKGSVQTVEQIDQERHIKITTAFYYTPSGRCINRPENGIRGGDEKEEELDSTEVESDSLVTDTTKEEVYFTNKGRKVYGGGGVIPDTIIKYKPETYLIQKLILKDVFFKYANYEFPILAKKGIVVDTSFVVEDDYVEKFYSYLDSIDFDYESMAEKKLEEFKVYSNLSVDTTIDSAVIEYLATNLTTELSSEIENAINSIEKLLEKNRRAELDSEISIIKREIFKALLVREIGRDNNTIHRMDLNEDAEFNSALKVISDAKLYQSLLEVKEVSKDEDRKEISKK